MRRVLRQGGRLGVAVWSVPEKVGIFLIPRIVTPALLPVSGEAPPSSMSMGEPGLIEGLVTEAGFYDVVTDHVTISHEIEDPESAWRMWSEDMSTPAGTGLAGLPTSERQRLHNEVIAAFESFRDGDSVLVPSEAIVVTAFA